MKRRFCPQCGSENVTMPRGDGLWWKCIKCGFEMNNFPEKEIKLKARRKNETDKTHLS